MEALRSLFPCFPQTTYTIYTSTSTPLPANPAEKASPVPQCRTDAAASTAHEILTLLCDPTTSSDPAGRSTAVLNLRCKEADAEPTWWRERVATGLIAQLTRLAEQVRRQETRLSGPLADAFGEAERAAGEFIEDHPIVFGVGVVVALGVALYLLGPWVLRALGFAARGPVRGSWAAAWQSLIGNVDYGSLFSYLQKLAAMWGKTGGVVA